MTPRVLRVGTRGSALAMAQSGAVAEAVARTVGATVELVRIRTEGDVNSGPLATIGGTGVFVTAVRQALRSGEVDLVVHSFKDLPTCSAPGLRLAAVPTRASPADALCARDSMTLAELPPGSTIGTGSPRRMAQIRSVRNDLNLAAIRGNVGTRLAKVTSGDLDAVVLAAAGLQRVGLQSAITEEFDPIAFLPAPAQGALAVECPDGEIPWFDAGLRALDDVASRWAAMAERAVLIGLEAGCSAPVSALGRFTERPRDGSAGGQTAHPVWLTLSGQATSLDGSEILRRDMIVGVSDDVSARNAGLQLASQLLSDGAADLVHGL